MAGPNWMAKLGKMEGAVDRSYNPYLEGVRTPSPSVNFTFGRTHLLPFGYSGVLFGPPKGGKTLLSTMMIGQLHQDYKDAFAVRFNTEMREEGQLGPAEAKTWGVDMSRFQGYNVNRPDLVFDRIAGEFNQMCQDGWPLKLVIIDSISGLMGRRQMGNDSVMDQTIGDLALTCQEGLKMILPVQRKHKFAVLLTAHVRAEMDQLEIRRGKKTKMAAAWATKHYAEYFMHIEHNQNAEGRKDMFGRPLESGTENLAGRAEASGHKIRVTMRENSVGAAGRVGEFTLDYVKGLVSKQEEIFLLASSRDVIEKSGSGYAFQGTRWAGKEATVNAIGEDPKLADRIMGEVRARDLAGQLGQSNEEKENAAEV